MKCFFSQSKRRKLNHNLIIDAKIKTELESEGYVILKNFFDTKTIENTRKEVVEIIENHNINLNQNFINSGRLPSSELRESVLKYTRNFGIKFLSPLINQRTATLNTGGALQLKPVGLESELNPHQDTPIVDETLNSAVYAWIPLQETNKKNGTITFLPKSHLWGNHQRSLNVPWAFIMHEQLLKKYMVPVQTNSGDLILFDSAIIHGSLPNLSQQPRLAFTTCILPKNYKLIHYFIDDNTPKNMVDVYILNETFFINEDIMKRPPEQYPIIKREKIKKFNWSEKKLIKQILTK